MMVDRLFPRRRMLAGAATATGLAGLSLVGCSSNNKNKNGASQNSNAPTVPTSASANASPVAAASPAATGRAATAAAAPTRTPKKGGTLIIDSGEPAPPSLVYAYNPRNHYLRTALWDQLIYQGVDFTPQLQLAETFEMKPDNSGVHIKLRSGLTFHDGKPINAAAVKAMIDTLRLDKTVSQLKQPTTYITDIAMPDDLTLDMTFDAPRPFMPDYFALLPIADASTVDSVPQMKTINGSGPFKFVSYTPNQGWRMERNPNYYRADRPLLDAIECKIYADDDARTLALQSGEIMLTNVLTYHMVAQLKKAKDVTIQDGGSGGSYYIGMVVTNPQLQDARVRRALSLAIDRDRIASDWAEGVVKTDVLPWPHDSPAYIADDEKLVSYDPDQAKALLKQAGVSGFTIPLEMDNTAASSSLAQLVQDDWKQIGVNAQFQIEDQNAFLLKLQQRKLQSLWVAFMGFGDRMYPATFFAFNQVVKVPNASQYGPQSYVDLLNKIAASDPKTPDGKALMHQWDLTYLQDDPFILPLVPNETFYAMRANVVSPAQGGMPDPLPEDVWINS